MAAKRNRRRKPITSISPISNLGDDNLLVEILIRLPNPRSLFRCKPVCRLWNSLIFTPDFSRRFLSHHQISPSDRPVCTPAQIREFIWNFLPLPGYLQYQFSFLDSIKDLTLLGFSGRRNDDELSRTFLVCNPFTEQWVALPLSPKLSATHSHYRSIVKLACEPVNSNGGLDLGDGQLFPSHLGYRRFRVVLMYDSVSGLSYIQVFCSSSSEWTKFALRLPVDLRCCYHHRVASDFNGNLYWLNQRWEVVKWNPFSLYYEEHHRILPTLIDGSEVDLDPEFYGPWASEGALHVVCTEGTDSVGLSIWRLEEDEEGRGGEWKKRYEILGLEKLRCSGMHADGSKVLEWEFERVIGLYGEKSELVFLECFLPGVQLYAILSCDFKTKEMEFYTFQDEDYGDEEVYQSEVTLWPSSIPNQEKLRNSYNGYCEFWLPPSKQSTS